MCEEQFKVCTVSRREFQVQAQWASVFTEEQMAPLGWQDSFLDLGSALLSGSLVFILNRSWQTFSVKGQINKYFRLCGS